MKLSNKWLMKINYWVSSILIKFMNQKIKFFFYSFFIEKYFYMWYKKTCKGSDHSWTISRV